MNSKTDAKLLGALEATIRRRIRHPNRRDKWLAIVIAVGTLTAMMVAFISLHSYGDRKLQQGLTKLESVLQMPVHIGYRSVGLGTATLGEVIIGDFGTAVFDRIEVDVVINPFSADFGKVSDLTLGRARVKLKHQKLIQFLEQATQRGSAGSKTGGVPTGDNLFQKVRRHLAGNFTIHNANLDILDRQGRIVTELLGVQGQFATLSRELTFQAREANFYSNWRLKNLKAHTRFLAKRERILFKVIAGQNSQNAALLKLEGSTDKRLKRGRIRFELEGLPNIALLHRFGGMQSNGFFRFQEDTRGSYEINGKLRSQVAMVKLPFLSSAGLGPVFGDANFEATFTPKSRNIMLRHSRIRLGDSSSGPFISFSASGMGRPDGTGTGMDWGGFVDFPETDCGTILASLPDNLVPNLKEFAVRGPMRFNLEYSFHTSEPQNFNHYFHERSFNCEVLKAPARYSARYLKSPQFLHQQMNQGRSDSKAPRQLAFAVPRGRTPLTDAFTTAEDAAFWIHNGIDEHGIVTAMRKNLDQRRIAMGGSTITMQTVKNLFLSHERTISRKLQEMFLAWHLEQTIGKRDIIQLYLNVIEFGPNIFGITEASRHFFDKTPEELNLKESAYLASVLPSPVRRYRNYCRGKLSDDYSDMLDGLIKRMHSLGRIDYGTMQRAMTTPLTFRRSGPFQGMQCQQMTGEDPS